MHGYIQVYTGDGKGKTTAALGLALRAAGAGLKVFIAQFVKGAEYSEIKALGRFSDLITLKQYGRGCFIYQEPAEEDKRLAVAGLEEAEAAMLSGQYQVIILDEVNIATYFPLFSVERLLDLIRKKPADVELILTGRKADPRIVEIADLVTEMGEIKHYYQKGVEARTGIEK
ncbi:MAG: cob(I)yrinic acid a,c-diamide adenosyltransferase [Deltaproteobacteria bacterium]|nr:cob(I)yrinic acid a,c-diamide adenosyltransferase [Deltaproteobacteria bacterium]